MADISPDIRPPMATELYAAGRVIGNRCFDQNHKFLECKAGDKDPAACIEEGTDVHRCVYGIYKEINSKAAPEFKAFTRCLDDNDLRTHECKVLQKKFENAYYGV
ncbi:hypothetical protein AB1Y20_009343 [Prymnesium parvum]|uniref:NADH dehydrogenase [ubiquinone] 1 alpha subcomplex subunit 8 n=1 Tax=Prymnesium parvum TaxID=97485 RepID=A0AB34K4A0_PRYPA